jgi:hypothetical protein
MTLLKRIDRTSMLIPYEQLFIQAEHQHGHLIAEQYMGEQNPLYQLAIDGAYTASQTIWTDQYSSTSTCLPVQSQPGQQQVTLLGMYTRAIYRQKILHFPKEIFYHLYVLTYQF